MKIYIKYPCLIFTLYFLACSNISKSRNAEWGNKINNTTLKNLHKVNDSIYRSEQPNSKEFKELEKMGIKSILNLRNDKSDSSLLGFSKLNYYQIKIVTVNFSDSEIIEALKVIKNAPKPLLIHCKHGADRTGVVTAMYRIIFEGWANNKAIDELNNGGYGFHKRYRNIPEYLNKVDIAAIKKMFLFSKKN